MTYIEFFVENDIENICGCLVSVPDRVIFIGDNKKKLQSRIERYSGFFADRGVNIEFLYKTVNKNSLSGIVDLLSEIVEEYDDCVFDLTGGQELMLVAVGIVYHRYRDLELQLHRFNLRSNKLYDCDEDGQTVSADSLPELTVEELVRLYGGKVVYDTEKPGACHKWNWSGDFIEDIDAMWEICRPDVRLWNTQIGVFAAAEELNGEEDSLTTSVNRIDLAEHLENCGGKYLAVKGLISALEQKGLMSFDESDDESLTLTYKNEQIKSCLTKAGQVLEMKMTLTAMLAKDKDGDPVYNSVMNGVFIDWDGDIHTGQDGSDTENEIDIIMMHGSVPVFVSCKNGMINIDELYKLNTVAERFGGKYAKKVLIATALGKDNPFAEYLRGRAAEMNIRLAENVRRASDKELERIVGSFRCG